MAIYHLSLKAIQRSKGHSAVAGASYRAGDKLFEERTQLSHDYTKKNGIIYSEILTPTGEKISREKIWNMAEVAEKRKDGITAKEYEISLPVELSEEEKKSLALEFAQYLVTRHECVADISLHQPSRQGDQRNFHAHILCTTRKYKDGQLAEKCDVELSDTDRKKKGLCLRKEELHITRKKWEEIQNLFLEKAHSKERVNCLSLAEQAMDREPTQHMGKNATAMERKGILPRRTRTKKLVDVVHEKSVILYNDIQEFFSPIQKRNDTDEQQIAKNQSEQIRNFDEERLSTMCTFNICPRSTERRGGQLFDEPMQHLLHSPIHQHASGYRTKMFGNDATKRNRKKI